jgi:hypothetical protein
MKQEEINKDLDSYIHERKDKPFWKRNSAQKIKPKLSEEDMDGAIKHEIEHVKEEEEHTLKPEDRHELEHMEKHVEKINDEEGEATERLNEKKEEVVEKADEEREGVLNKFFKKLNFSDKKEKKEEKAYEPAVMSNNPEITMDDEETRELLHGLHNWIIQLPADKLEKFKNSREFELYTKYLRKHNLIK